MDKQFNLITVIEAVRKRFLAIVIITVVVFAAVFIITHPRLDVVAPEYESTTMFYAANLSLLDRPYIFESQHAVDLEFDQFGRREDVDRMVSIALSGQVLKHLVMQFNLIEHYKINKEKEKYPESAAISRLKKKYKALKNEYNAVEISVKDADAKMAADIANEAVSITDKIHREMVMEGRERIKNVLEKQIAAKNTEVQELSAQLTSATDAAQQKNIDLRHSDVSQQLLRYTNLLDQFELVTAEDLSTVRIMEVAYPQDKDTGLRWLIILGALFTTLFALIFGATILHVMSE